MKKTKTLRFQSRTKKMWLKATKVIPEGNLMISKNPLMFSEKDGQVIFPSQKVVLYGTLIIKNILIVL